MSEIKVTEAEFLSSVIELGKLCGWRVAHFRPAWTNKGYRTAIQGDAGYPDYTAVRNGILLFVEFKSNTGRLSPDQEDWAKLLKQIALINPGVQYYLWRPKDWEEIVEVLR